jgi:hypothetical protein
MNKDLNNLVEAVAAAWAAGGDEANANKAAADALDAAVNVCGTESCADLAWELSFEMRGFADDEDRRKLRRRVEDAMRKMSSDAQLIFCALVLGVKI